MHEFEATEFVHKYIESEAEKHFSRLKYKKESVYYKFCPFDRWTVFVLFLGADDTEEHHKDAMAFRKFREYTWVQFYRYLNGHGTEHIEEYLCYLTPFYPDKEYRIY